MRGTSLLKPCFSDYAELMVLLKSVAVLVNLHDLVNSLIFWNLNIIFLCDIWADEAATNKMSSVEPRYQGLRSRQTDQSCRIEILSWTRLRGPLFNSPRTRGINR